MKKLFESRYAVLAAFVSFFLFTSFIVRAVLLFLSFKKAGLSFIGVCLVFGKGMIFDLAVASFFSVLYALYLLLLPKGWNNGRMNRIITYTGFFLAVLICMFSFFAELSFWGEFESRFNFIAVDYLVYTFEVINNINESYPLPWLISTMLCMSIVITILVHRRGYFAASFDSVTRFRQRLLISGSILGAAVFFASTLSNTWAEHSQNRYKDELAKAGIFSFFAAFKNNELDYFSFYAHETEDKAFHDMREVIKETGAKLEAGNSIERWIADSGFVEKPNVIMVTIESFSADFMSRFGNRELLTPNLDKIANESILFTDMYATGTRTVRGMEALTLAVPPTPGNSIVRRQNNEDLFNVGTIFKKEGYKRTFFYGGDGYFDNMNDFFGNNGFDIVDRGRQLLDETFEGSRSFIADSNVQFENAWGVCDEDIYEAVLRDADRKFINDEKFFDFVMTTSNHRPYTYPGNKIDIPSGSGREGAVKYTDYAIGKFVEKIRSKPWFKNTVIIFVADHCASSAGKNEINISKYHIPCMLWNMPGMKAQTIDKQCSQIDLYPTLFALLNWQYESNLFGKNVMDPTYAPRALVGTYQKLGYLENDTLIMLSPQEKVEASKWNKQTDEQTALKADPSLVARAIAYYQTAYTLFKNGGMKERKLHVLSELSK